MKFRYFRFPLEKRSKFFGSSLLKPIIPIELTHDKQSLRYAALIDSGADFCIFDGEIGENLGLNIRSGTQIEFGGIQERGSAKAYLHNITIGVGGYYNQIWAGFSFDIAKTDFGVLGQKGFFELFFVKFDFGKEEVELIPR